VRLVEVDGLDAQARERRLACLPQMEAAEAVVVRTVAHPKACLGGEHDLVAPPAPVEPAADDLLGRPVRVHVRRVHEVAARLEVAIEHRVTGRLVSLGAEGHRAERVGADGNACLA
jgi:hypothetical protein